MRIGIFGGTFNPPHLGHLAAARAAVSQFSLDRLLLVPAGLPPHKKLPADSPDAAQRLAMTQLAAGYLELPDRTEVLDLELAREGRSYTADTLRELAARYPDAELWLLMGSDMFLSFESWYTPEEIIKMATLLAFDRAEEGGELARQRERLLAAYPGARIELMQVPDVVDISSTELRTGLSRGEGERYLPPAVCGYILREHLYGTCADLKHLSLEQLRPVALSYLKHKRIPHVLGTEREAVRLAETYGADVQKARVAALLHDCTKKLTLEEQLALCKHYRIELDELEKNALKLLHAKTGAALARDVFGVDDEIYGAILWHTTGRAEMSLLEKIIYLADYIEPTRDFPGVDKLRKVCYDSLDAGLLLGLNMTIQEMTEMGNPVHKNTIEARDGLKG